MADDEPKKKGLFAVGRDESKILDSGLLKRYKSDDPTDWSRYADDPNGLLNKRRLTREEGLFCGGSSGGMAHIAVQVAREMGPGKKVVVVLPDNAGRYLTKYLDDNWMKMHGFLEPRRGLGLIEDLLEPGRAVITCTESESVADVVSRMRSAGVSQIPVVDPHGKPLGMVHEIDLLRGLSDGTVTGQSPVKDIEAQLMGQVHPKAQAEELFGVFGADEAAIVVDEGKVIGVLTEIDLIEHMAKQK